MLYNKRDLVAFSVVNEFKKHEDVNVGFSRFVTLLIPDLNSYIKL